MADTEHEYTVDVHEFRHTMGLFATGVSVLAVSTEEGDVQGMTANAITSVSLNPRLILICVDKKARITPAMLEAETFTLSFLSEAQQPLSNYFAGLWNDEYPAPAFDFIEWEGGHRLAGTLGSLFCRQYEVHEGGDHWIVLGEVQHVFQADEQAEPLLFFRGRYWQIDSDA